MLNKYSAVQAPIIDAQAYGHHGAMHTKFRRCKPAPTNRSFSWLNVSSWQFWQHTVLAIASQVQIAQSAYFFWIHSRNCALYPTRIKMCNQVFHTILG